MKRFLMLVSVAVVAAAMYVAASPASQQSAPTARQFKALKRQVASLSKTLKKVKTEADAAVGIIGACYLHQNTDGTVNFTVMPVSQFGNSSSGFLYGTSGLNAPRTALDITTSSPQAYLQEVDPACATVSALKHGAVPSGSSRVQRWAEHAR
jgi:hypothetical protein